MQLVDPGVYQVVGRTLLRPNVEIEGGTVIGNHIIEQAGSIGRKPLSMQI